MKKTIITTVSIVCVTAIIITGLVLGYDYIQSERQFKFDIAKEIADIMATEKAGAHSSDSSSRAYNAGRYFYDIYNKMLATVDGE